eukprot:COSAG04_NODE_1298_length_7325_cov_2.902989_1_plen_71_part_00
MVRLTKVRSAASAFSCFTFASPARRSAALMCTSREHTEQGAEAQKLPGEINCLCGSWHNEPTPKQSPSLT